MHLSALLVSLSAILGTSATPIPTNVAAWTDCPTNISTLVKCLDITVPLDYDDPQGEQLNLKLINLPANNTDARRGSLVWQLGGPGEVTSDTVIAEAEGNISTFGELRPYFDIIVADPRGVGLNHPVKCDPKFGQTQSNFYPETEEEFQEVLKFFDEMGKDCLNRTGNVMNFMDTKTQARDLEAVRIALGEGKLNYCTCQASSPQVQSSSQLTLATDGLSWGSLRGSQYAQIYPDHINTMVLDGIVDHSMTVTQFTASEAHSYSATQRRMLEWVASNSTSAMHGRDMVTLFHELIDGVNQNPIHMPECARSEQCFPSINDDDIRNYAFRSANGPILWPQFALDMKEAIDNNNFSAFVYPLSTSETSIANSMFGIACQDWDFPKTWTDYRQTQYLNSAFSTDPQGPIGARMWAVGCPNWPTKKSNPPAPLRIENKDSAKIMLVNSLWDPATGYDQALNVHDQIDNSVLVTRYGEGHGSWEWPETRKIIDEYLIEGSLRDQDDLLFDRPFRTWETDFEMLNWSEVDTET